MALTLNPVPVGRRHSLYTRSDSILEDPANSTAVTKDYSHSSYSWSTSSDENCTDTETIVTLNVGGQIFKTKVDTLKKIEGSKLQFIAHQALKYSLKHSKPPEYFFDRNPVIFSYLLDYCRDEELHYSKRICVMSYRNDLKYWGVSENLISDCCKKKFMEALDEVRLNESLVMEFQALKPKSKCSATNRRGQIYNILHYPETSIAAKVWAAVYYILVVLSVFSIYLSTVPSCRVPVSGEDLPPLYSQSHDHDDHESTPNNTLASYTSDYILQQMETNTKIRMLVTTRAAPALQYIDIFCVFFFTAEFIARVATVPKILHLFKQFFTLCDLTYLVSVWILWIVQLADESFWRKPEHIMAYLVLECLIVARVMALFRVANQYRSLRILVLSLKASLGEILLLIVFVIFAMIVFAAIIYCVEIFVVDTMENMFYGLWWSLITMTTVGYGDSVPKSGVGYLVACLCAMTGIILIGMVVPIITSNFHKYYGFRHPHDDFNIAPSVRNKTATPKPRKQQPNERLDPPALFIDDLASNKVLSA